MPKSSKKKIEDMSQGEAEEIWRKTKKADATPPAETNRMSLFTLRVDNETLDELVRLAEEEGVGPSVVARRLIQESLERRRIAPTIAKEFETQLYRTVDDFYKFLFIQKTASSLYSLATSFAPTENAVFAPKKEAETSSPESKKSFKFKEAI
jgi:hypothetical protein